MELNNSFTLEASYFRALPEETKNERVASVPLSTSIKYNGSLINYEILYIDEGNLIEFGKYFAHIVNHHYNQK